MTNIIYVEPEAGAPGICPQYESSQDDPIHPCIRDAEELGEAGIVECWVSWGGPAGGFVCPFMD